VTRDRHPAGAPSPKAVRRSRDRGCNGHRILRRVPADGRHPGSSRGIGFHETVTTVILAVFGFSDESREGEPNGEFEVRDRGVRGSVASAPWEENAHVRFSRPQGSRERSLALHDRPAEAVFGRRETSGPSAVSRGALHSTGPPRRESGESELRTHEVRVHAVRLGGRSRLDASRVFFTGRSQDLLVARGR